MTMESDRRRARIAALLDNIGAEDGDERYRRAAGFLRGKRSGRPPMNDTDALAYAAKLVAGGASKNSACGDAAVRYELEELAIDATKARLLGKL